MIYGQFIRLPLAVFGAVLLASILTAQVRSGAGRLFLSSSHTSFSKNHGGGIWFDLAHGRPLFNGPKFCAYAHLYPEIDSCREPITLEESPIIESDFSASLNHSLVRVAKFDLLSGPNEIMVQL